MNRDEVEEFLRRAAQRRAQAEAQRRARMQGAQPQPPAQPAIGQPIVPRPVAPQGKEPDRAVPPRLRPGRDVPGTVPLHPVEAEIVTAQLADQGSRFGVAERTLGDSAARLGAEVGLADDHLDAHLHQVFDHQIGSLRTSSMEAGAASPSAGATAGGSPAANSLLQMFRTPESLRNAIILNEILTRPEDRW